MAFATSNVAGVNFTDVFTPPSPGDYNYGAQPAMALGTRVTGSDGSVWVYVVLGAGGTTGPSYVCRYDEDFLAVMLSTGNDDFGEHVGVPVCPAALEDDYIWLQIAGPADIQVSASAAANAALSTTATAGQLDDAGGLIVDGIILTTARPASAGTAPGVLNFPTVTATAGP